MVDRFFLPDFCTARNIVTVAVIVQLTAFLLALARPGDAALWADLLRLSLFLHWIALVGAGVLCLCRGWLATLRPRYSVVVAFALLVGVAVALAEMAWWTAQFTGIGVALVPADRADFLLRTLGLAAIVSAVVLRYLWIRNQWRERVRSEALTRFAALQARIRPHFLFNSMNTIAALTRDDPGAAEQAIEDLADLLRAALTESDGRVLLGEELDLCRRYTRMESLRLGERLQVAWQVDGLPGDALIPGLIVQPLLENAIYHGVEPAICGATVLVTGRHDERGVCIEVRNPMPPERTHPQHGMRIGLANVAERVALAFPGAGTLDAQPADGEFVVVLRFPYETVDATTDRR